MLPGYMEILIIVVVLLVVFGGAKGVDTVKRLGKTALKAKKEIDDIKKLI